MFDILEADIVVFQETKIQRKDLSDDMVLVPGWDCYFSLPRHKKGYSGVVIYTRQSVCAPIRAEEGVTGILCPPNSSTSFSNLAEDQQIGGYPTSVQLAASGVDAITLDSEGRCVVLEFPAFVLFGVYSPANRDESRDDFRLGFLGVLDSRVRNLIGMGKRVLLTGDLNISRDELDAANAEASMRKQGLTGSEFVSTPARRLFNHLLEGGKVVGNRDQGRECSVMWDICRAFHPDRKGMFTCWEQKVNARPGNCGSRIDYVLCSLAMKNWFSDSNIQEGLMGSDHCPVYAVMKDKICIDGEERHVRDMMNPLGMFSASVRQREYSTINDPLPMSGRLIPEFFGRRNIRDMFARKPSIPSSQSTVIANSDAMDVEAEPNIEQNATMESLPKNHELAQVPLTSQPANSTGCTAVAGKKRSLTDAPNSRYWKRSKNDPTPTASPASGKGQQSLAGFFKPKAAGAAISSSITENPEASEAINQDGTLVSSLEPGVEGSNAGQGAALCVPNYVSSTLNDGPVRHQTDDIEPAGNLASADDRSIVNGGDRVHDPVESKETWSKLFAKPAAPRCEGHDEPCITLLTKKAGMNLGRSFWMCRRPLGPSGAKEKNTQWRCQTFIWCSDWNSRSASGGMI